MAFSVPTNDLFNAAIAQAAGAAGTDPALLKAHVAVESGFDPNAQNLSDPNGGAWGLAQLDLATAASLGYQGDGPGLLDPQTNLNLAAILIAKNLAEAVSVTDAISAYNAGFSTLFPGFGPRTQLSPPVYVNQVYVNDVQAAYAAYQSDFPGAILATAGRGGYIDMALMYGIAALGVLAAALGWL